MAGIEAQAGERKIVSEDAVMLSVKESVDAKHTQAILAELETMRMQ